MNASRFGALVRRLERRSRGHPRIYRLQVGVVAAVGYGYVLGILALLSAAIAGLGYLAMHVANRLIVVAVMIPLVILAYVVVRSLWIRLPDVQGLPLTAERFPELASEIERVRAHVDAPRFRRVLLDDDFNATVSQSPRFGPVGPSVSDLVIGLPLMQALSPLEFEAVLAHEMAHVCRRHGRFGHWTYRLRLTWSRLAAVVQAAGALGANVLWGRFLAWYAPLFNAYSFVMARQDEYEADQTASRVASRDAVASALVRLQVVGRFHAERHWGAVGRELIQGTSLPSPHATFPQVLAEWLQPSETQSWLVRALRRPTDYGDTHPSLADRLRAIEACAPAELSPLTQSAADVFLGSEAHALARELDERWRAQVEPEIAEVRAEMEHARQRLEELERNAESGVEADWVRAQLLERLGRDAEARAAAESIIAAHPDHAQALFYLGRVRLAAEEPEGIPLLERAATLHPLAAPAAHSLIFDYLWGQGRLEEAERARAALDAASDLVERAERERTPYSEDPVFVPHDLPCERVDRIRRSLAEIPDLRAVYLVRRVVVEMPELACYYVGLVPAKPWWKFRRAAESAQLQQVAATAVSWPDSTYLLVKESPHTGLVRRMQKVPGAALLGPDAKPEPATLERLRQELARRRRRWRRLRPVLIAATTVVVVGGALAYREYHRVIATTPIQSFTAADVAERVRESRGRVLVVAFYSPNSTDAALVLRLHQWAAPLGPSRAEVFALAVGDRRDAQAFFRYLPQRGLSELAPSYLEPRKPGVLDRPITEVGIGASGDTWTIPLVALVDPRGRVVAEWQGLSDAALVIAAAQVQLLE